MGCAGIVRILHVQETLASNYGGPAKVLPELARAQSALGHDVAILTTTGDVPRGRYHPPGTVRLDGSEVDVTYVSDWPAAMRFAPGVVRYLQRRGRSFDLIHVHGLYRFPPSYAARFARHAGIPYVIRPHGSLDPYLYARSSRNLWLKRGYERFIDLPNLHGASAIHYTTAEEANRAAFMNLRAPRFVVPNGLDWAPFESLPPRGGLRARLGIGDNPLVLFLGRLHPKKGMDILIDAFARLHAENPSVRLAIVGPDADGHGAEVRLRIAALRLDDAVTFAGPLYGRNVLNAYVDADVFALPSYTENFGMTVVEAMACATPVAISDQVNIRSEVERAGAGIVTACDAGAFAAALAQLLQNASARRAMGAAGRALVQSTFAWPSIVRALDKEYAAAIARHAAR